MTGWPFHGDTPLDRARRVAASYRQALLDRYPDAAFALDDQFTDWGETWVAPTLEPDLDLEAWVTVDVAADHVGLTVKAVYQWVYRSWLDSKKCNDGRIRVRLGDALDVNAGLRKKRAGRARDAA